MRCLQNEETGGIDGVRDFNLLESAIETPFQVFDGEELYPTIQAKGTHAMLIFFALNGIELRYTQKELYAMVLAVADGSLEYDAMLKWILEHQA